MDKNLDYFLKEIKNNPSDIMSKKYDYISTMFPQEYIKGMKIYVEYLLREISKKEYDLKIYRIRSKL